MTDPVAKTLTTLEAEPVSGVTATGDKPLRAGRYRLDYVLGKGATSIVYAAYDVELDRRVAVKELRPGVGFDPSMFLKEAKTLAALRHENVVHLYSIERPADASPFLVMEHVPGTTLSTMLRHELPSLREALGLLRQVAAGLDAIHAAGLVHGDVKPANVLVDDRGVVKLVDVGLAPFLFTMEPGDIVGTPRYLAPERALGVPADRDLAPRGDLYSFAVMAMELLTGRLPFDFEGDAQAIAAHGLARPKMPSQLGVMARSFDVPFARALDKEPTNRHRTCGSLVAAIERASAGTDPLGRSLRVLVVDDDEDMRLLVSHGLAQRLPGATIETVSDGELALEAARRAPPAIAVLDWRMPGLQGADLLGELKKAAPDTSIFVVTGHGSGRDWVDARRYGARRFFVKPVELDELAGAITDVTRERRAPRSGPGGLRE